MNKLFKTIVILCCCVLASSCVVISRPVAATDAPFGNKCGVSKSVIYCGIVSRNGQQNGINQAARNGHIRKISHVDSYTTVFLFGLITTQETRVYGE
jgi:hypothetical protein